MHSWTSPKGCTVTFKLRSCEENSAALYRLHTEFKLDILLHGFHKFRLSDPRWVDLLPRLGRDTPFDFECCWINEPNPRADTANGWFRLSLGRGEFRTPARAASSQTLGYRKGQIVASERLLTLVRERDLTGLGMLPLEDSSNDDPIRWFEVYAENPIGRGLDHPLVDPATINAERVKERFDPARRWGEPVAWLKYLWRDAEIRDSVAAALVRMEPNNFRIAGPERFVREHTPPADFAYLHWGYNRDSGPGFAGRPIRHVCCSARARAAIIEAGLLKPSDFEPLAVVAAADAGADILDRTITAPLPLPVYTPKEAEIELRRRREIITARTSALRPRPFTPVTAADLRARIAAANATWEPASTSPDFALITDSELFAPTPAAWQEFAPLLPAELEAPTGHGDEAFYWIMCPPEWNDWLAEDDDDRDESERPSEHDLIIGRTPFGDWYAFRRDDPLLPADARIVHWDHETTCIDQEWPSIAAFASFIISLCDRQSGKSA